MTPSRTLTFLFTGLAAGLCLAAPASPDSLVLPARLDTLTEGELRIYPPEGARLPVRYQVSWGDGETLDWTLPLQTATDISRYHRYRRFGDFQVRARLRDATGAVSAWGRPLEVTVGPSLLKWVFPTFDPITGSPALDRDGNVYVGDESGWFYSIAPDGQLRWSFQAGGPMLATACIAPDPPSGAGGFFRRLFGPRKPARELVYVPSLDSQLYCLDTDGNLVWKTHLGDELYTAPAVDAAGGVYVGTDAGRLVKVSRLGAVEWEHDTGDEITGSPSVGADGLVYITSDSVYCLDARGRLRWTFGTPTEDYFYASPVPDIEGNVYAGCVDGYVYCLRPDGRLRWRAPTPDEDEIKPEVVYGPDGVLWFGDDGYYFNRKTPDGTVEHIYEADDYIIATAAVAEDGTVYFLPEDGYLYALGPTGRLRWKLEVAVEGKDLYCTSAPVIAPDGTVYVGSWDGGVYAFQGGSPPARSGWPQYRHDAGHTGRLTR